MGSSVPNSYIAMLASAGLLFALIVGYGWYHIVLPWTQNPLVAVVISGFLVFIALIAARHAAIQIARHFLDGSKTGILTIIQGVLLYIPLVLISVLGTLNTMFLYAEARAIFRDDVRSIQEQYTLLNKDAARILVTPELDRKIATVEGILTSLRSEIDNPNEGNFCGVGEQAQRIIATLRAELPGFEVPRGSGPIVPCDRPRARAMASAFEANARALLASHPDILARNGPERVRTREAIRQSINGPDGPVSALNDLEARAQGVGPIGPTWMAPLVSAKNTYNDLSGQLGGFAEADGEQRESVATLEPPLSEQLNSYAGTIPLLLSRLDTPTTWFYVFLALALDGWLIFTMWRIAMHLGRIGDSIPRYELKSERQYMIDPRFIGRA